MIIQHDTQHLMELEKNRRALIAKSDEILSWLASSVGKPVPEFSVMRILNHSDDCAEWLMDSVHFDDFDDWLDRLSADDRAEFETSLLPFTLLAHNSYTHNLYEMIGESLKGQEFRHKFEHSMVDEVRKFMKMSFVKSGGDLSGTLDSILLPKLVSEDGRFMLHPELYAQVNGLAKVNIYKAVVTCTYAGWAPEERGVRALTALANKVDPELGQRYLEQVAPQLVHFAPSKCPVMRKKLTGNQDISMDECSQRMAIVMGMNAANLENPQLPLLAEAIDLCPDYREKVMRLDMAESIRNMIDNPKPEASQAATCTGIAKTCKTLGLTQHDINWLLLKVIGGHGNGKLGDLDSKPASEGLNPILTVAIQRGYDTIREFSALAELACEMLKISDPQTVLEVTKNDDASNAFMYKLTQNDQFLHRVKDGEHLDSCFSSDLGL